MKPRLSKCDGCGVGSATQAITGFSETHLCAVCAERVTLIGRGSLRHGMDRIARAGLRDFMDGVDRNMKREKARAEEGS